MTAWVSVTSNKLIHELTHVWQGLQEGPVYMIEALEAQLIGAGYNYGYADTPDGDTFGDGGETALVAANGDFGTFNKEQQAQIIMHYFARKNATPAKNVVPWQPYANVVAACFVIDLPDLGGAQKIRDLGVPVRTLVEFGGH